VPPEPHLNLDLDLTTPAGDLSASAPWAEAAGFNTLVTSEYGYTPAPWNGSGTNDIPSPLVQVDTSKAFSVVVDFDGYVNFNGNYALEASLLTVGGTDFKVRMEYGWVNQEIWVYLYIDDVQVASMGNFEGVLGTAHTLTLSRTVDTLYVSIDGATPSSVDVSEANWDTGHVFRLHAESAGMLPPDGEAQGLPIHVRRVRIEGVASANPVDWPPTPEQLAVVRKPVIVSRPKL
jgi:hypothetical protein